MLKCADRCYYMGKSHVTCDDFSLCHSWNDVHVAIVVDGCSGSKNSDIGSRLLAMELAIIFERGHVSYENIVASIKVDVHAALLYLRDRYSSVFGAEFLDCTLLVMVSDETRTTAFVMGDGAVLMERKDGSQIFYRYDFDNNMPAYQSYLLDRDRMARYFSEVKGYDVTVANVVDDTVGTALERVSFSGAVPTDEELMELEALNTLPVVQLEWSHDIVSKVALCTDGIESFAGPQGPVDWVEVARKVLASKVANMGFIQRRVSRIMEDYAKESIFNADDVSVIALVME